MNKTIINTLRTKRTSLECGINRITTATLPALEADVAFWLEKVTDNRNQISEAKSERQRMRDDIAAINSLLPESEQDNV